MFPELHQFADDCDLRLSEMEGRFNSLASRYDSHRKFAEETVERWEWTALPRHELQPFFFELGDARRGRVMRGQPEMIAGRHQYGFSPDQSLLVERQHTEFPGRYYETFFIYGAREVTQDRYSYDGDKSPINSTRLFRQSDTKLCFQRWSTGGNAQIVYELSQGRLIAQMSIYRRFGKGDSFGGLHALEYLPDDRIRIWAMSRSGDRKLAYEGPRVSVPHLWEFTLK